MTKRVICTNISPYYYYYIFEHLLYFLYLIWLIFHWLKLIAERDATDEEDLKNSSDLALVCNYKLWRQHSSPAWIVLQSSISRTFVTFLKTRNQILIVRYFLCINLIFLIHTFNVNAIYFTPKICIRLYSRDCIGRFLAASILIGWLSVLSFLIGSCHQWRCGVSTVIWIHRKDVKK